MTTQKARCIKHDNYCVHFIVICQNAAEVRRNMNFNVGLPFGRFIVWNGAGLVDLSNHMVAHLEPTTWSEVSTSEVLVWSDPVAGR